MCSMLRDMFFKKNYDEMCKRIARIITGWHKPTYRRGSKYKGDLCIVVNADKI